MAQPNDLQLTYIGGPTLLIEFGGLRLLTDPTFDPHGQDYVTGAVTLFKTADPAMDASAIGSIDAVLLSHDHHFDNLDHAGRSLLPSAKTVITTRAGAERLGGNAIGLEPWQSTELSAPNGETLRVIGTPARHGPEVGERGPVTGFLISHSDLPAHLIYVSGDTVWYEGVEETLRRYPAIRLAILFLGAARIPIVPSHLTFTAKEAVLLSKRMPQARIVPVHFEGWKHFSESKQDVLNAFAAESLESRLLWLEAGRSMQLEFQ
ncbi:MAG: MBL fold metallo-hydrolase [Terriglobales bacterium]|jgi:L-ascorbate metabolism protein UlaG (beta-lactamase superfamily)